MVACTDVISLGANAAHVMGKLEYWSHLLERGIAAAELCLRQHLLEHRGRLADQVDDLPGPV